MEEAAASDSDAMNASRKSSRKPFGSSAGFTADQTFFTAREISQGLFGSVVTSAENPIKKTH